MIWTQAVTVETQGKDRVSTVENCNLRSLEDLGSDGRVASNTTLKVLAWQTETMLSVVNYY